MPPRLGWVFQYALVDTSGKHSLADLRSYQDWYLRYYLRSVPGVAEVAPIGGYTRQYQVNLDPNRLRAYGIPVSRVVEAVRSGNDESSGRLLEFGGTEYMVRGRGYARSLEDFENIPLSVSDTGSQIRIKDVGQVVDGARPAARPRRSGRQGRGRFRHRRHAQRRERAGRHRPGESQDQRDRARVSGGREARSGLRPLGADPQHHRHREERPSSRSWSRSCSSSWCFCGTSPARRSRL